MGLSGVKKRSKLSHDPNNTTWARNTENFGHKILSKQGWKQGDYLGAENANHSDHYTAANASHIRVLLREDNLGLGAQVGKGNAETFGLSMFSGILGRLNGKSDGEVQKQQDSIRDAELRTYQANKYGFMNFVSGGLLVGDKMEFPKSTKLEDIKQQAESDDPDKRKSKKRKADHDSDAAVEPKKARKVKSSAVESSEKSKSKEEGDEEQSKWSSSSDSEEDKAKRKARRKAEKAAKAAKKSETVEDDEKARLKEEKRVRKEERRKRKEEKRQRKAEKEDDTKHSNQPSTTTSENEGSATPPVANRGMTMTGGRHAVRQRYIMQKRMASMDANALKEIFMLKPQPAS